MARSAGEVPLAIFPERPGLTTTDPAVVRRHPASRIRRRHITTRVAPLEDILAAHCREIIDFIKIDLEGVEADVLASFDLARWAPRALVIEATRARSNEPSHRDWELDVVAAGYELAQFDGLNQFYARTQEPALIDALSAPAGACESFYIAGISRRESRGLDVDVPRLPRRGRAASRLARRLGRSARRRAAGDRRGARGRAKGAPRR